MKTAMNHSLFPSIECFKSIKNFQNTILNKEGSPVNELPSLEDELKLILHFFSGWH